MTQNALQAQLAALLRETEAAHHRAFAAVDGHDPDWPQWYAERLREPLRRLLGRTISAGELAGWLAEADRRHNAAADGAHWADYYAADLLARLG